MTLTDWVTAVLTGVTDWVTAALTGVIAVLTYLNYRVFKLTYRAYRLMSRPIVFAWLRDGKEEPGIRVENAGKGAAWNGRITIKADTSKAQTRYDFTRLYEQSRYEYPIENQPRFMFDPSRDNRINIEITYDDEETGGKQYRWVTEFNLQREWLQRANK